MEVKKNTAFLPKAHMQKIFADLGNIYTKRAARRRLWDGKARGDKGELYLWLPLGEAVAVGD